jgi:hypothetical protein
VIRGPGCVDDFAGECPDLIDLHDAADLGHQPAGEPEVAVGGAQDGRAGFVGSEVVGVFMKAGLWPASVEHEDLLVGGEWLVVVQEPDSTVKLRVAGQPAFDAGHADQNQADPAAVVVVAQCLQAGVFESVARSSPPKWLARLPHPFTAADRAAATATSSQSCKPIGSEAD